MHHIFDIEIATQYGVSIAIFLNNISFWIKKNIANEEHFYDGYYWTYNSLKAYSVLFPYWTPKQLRAIVDKCIENGLLIKGNYNKSKYDQTSWYALTENGLALCRISICPNGQINETERANESDQMGKPIPDINTDIKTYNIKGDKKSSSKKEKRKALLPLDELPSWLDKELWVAFREHREELKSPLTPQAEKMAIHFLMEAKDKGHDTSALIRKTIANGWKGIFIDQKQNITQKNDSTGKNSPSDAKPLIAFPPKDNLCQDLVRASNSKVFSHPIVFLLFQLIGSYALKHNTEFDIKQKINNYYKDVCNEYASDPESVRRKMEYFEEHGSFMSTMAANSVGAQIAVVKRPEYFNVTQWA